MQNDPQSLGSLIDCGCQELHHFLEKYKKYFCNISTCVNLSLRGLAGQSNILVCFYMGFLANNALMYADVD